MEKYLVGEIKIDGFEPTDEWFKFVEKEKNGTLTKEEIEKFTDQPHKIKE